MKRYIYASLIICLTALCGAQAVGAAQVKTERAAQVSRTANAEYIASRIETMLNGDIF